LYLCNVYIGGDEAYLEDVYTGQILQATIIKKLLQRELIM
jgi:hypothetical protein